MLKGWKQTGRGEQYGARIVNYADDFVILSRGKANESLESTRGVLERLGLTLNERRRASAMRVRSDPIFWDIHSGRTQPTNGAAVYGPQSVKEEREADQAEGGRASGAQQRGTVGRSARPAEQETERLESVL